MVDLVTDYEVEISSAFEMRASSDSHILPRNSDHLAQKITHI